jgi:prepilin-type N-terminal cleavage/methylation domain-containing protein
MVSGSSHFLTKKESKHQYNATIERRESMKMLKNEKGFTLIELVLTIVVLGVLAAFATIQFGTITQTSRDAALQGASGTVGAQLAVAINDLRGLPTIAAPAGGVCVTGVGSATFGDRVRNCISMTGNVFISPINGANDGFNICTGGACTNAVPPAACGSTNERYMTVTYAANGTLTYGAIGNCAS